MSIINVGVSSGSQESADCYLHGVKIIDYGDHNCNCRNAMTSEQCAQSKAGGRSMKSYSPPFPIVVSINNKFISFSSFASINLNI